MLRIKIVICLFILIPFVSMTGCAITQPVLEDCNNSVLRINDKNVVGKFETIEITVTDEEIEEELAYRLIQYSELERVEEDIIENGDVVYILVTLYDSSYKVLPDYNDMEIEFIIGDWDFDEVIEKTILGKKVGEELEVAPIGNTVFYDIKDARYYSLKIIGAERYVFPLLTESFLRDNFSVHTKDELYDKMREEVEWIKYELALSSLEDELVERIITDSDFDESFESKVEHRYKTILEKYRKYGELYGITCEEVLQEFGMDLRDVRENAKTFQGEWELVLYYVAQGELQLDKQDIDTKMKEYAIDNGYSSVKELINDSGEQYLIEQVCVKEMKDYLYQKYVGEIEENEN